MNTQVKSADRVLDILELFASTDRRLALRDVAAILRLPKSSAHMLLATLSARGYLTRDRDDRFALVRAMREGGWVGGVAGQIFRVAQPWMDLVVERHEESVVLGGPTPTLDVRILTHRNSPLAVHYDVSLIPVLPGWGTAMGHAILACLPEDRVRPYLEAAERVALTARTLTEVDDIMARLAQTRARGYALNLDERIEGASGAAVAIRGPDGQPHAAINCVTLTPRFRRKRTEIVRTLTEAARSIEAEVFGPGPVQGEISA